MANGNYPKFVEELKITVLMDNYYDGLLPPAGNVSRYGFVRMGGEVVQLPPDIMAEHGFSCYIEVVVEGKKHALLMDFGVSADGVVRNVRAMGLDLGAVEALVLSHGHFDHFGGLKALAGEFFPGVEALPFYVGKDAFLKRYINLPGMRVDLGRLSREEIELLGLEVKEIGAPAEVLPGVMLIGPLPRVTPFEQGSPILGVENKGAVEQDSFPGELSMAFRLAGRGMVVLSACAHAGIINTVLQAKEVTGEERVHAILGGFHLSGAPAEKIEKTAEGLSQFNPDMIVPMHCTGFQALKAISGKLGDAFVLYSVGTEYRFTGIGQA